ETISRITDKVVAEMTEWSTRPLDPVYVAVFVDAIVVKVRDGQVANRPVYAAIGVRMIGRDDTPDAWRQALDFGVIGWWPASSIPQDEARAEADRRAQAL